MNHQRTRCSAPARVAPAGPGKPTPLRGITVTVLVVLLLGMAQASAQPRTSVALNSTGFLGAHPDIRWRNEAIEHYDRKEYAEAIRDLKLSARYADKGSQGLLAEMHWRGLGTPPDRPLAYAWMDLAGESGYVEFVALREWYWSQLSGDERRQALVLGEQLYREYGDAVAKPRLAKILNRARRGITGSRTGFRGPLEITIRMPGGGYYRLNGEEYYADEFWKPDDYFEWKNEVWKAARRGTVEIGPLENAD